MLVVKKCRSAVSDLGISQCLRSQRQECPAGADDSLPHLPVAVDAPVTIFVSLKLLRRIYCCPEVAEKRLRP
jgi:hypothetical protein